MGDESNDAFTRLSPRMRDCLRLVYDRKRTGEIATILGVEEGTAKSYIAHAVRLLGARDRIDAAELFHAHEVLTAPTNPALSLSGVAAASVVAPVEGAATSQIQRWQLPIRQPGATDNELTVAQRVLWVAATPVIVAVGFGMLAIGLRVLSDLVHAIWGFRH